MKPNRKARRALAVGNRRRARILHKLGVQEDIKPDTDLALVAKVELRLGYRAYKLGRITKDEARFLGCRIS